MSDVSTSGGVMVSKLDLQTLLKDLDSHCVLHSCVTSKLKKKKLSKILCQYGESENYIDELAQRIVNRIFRCRDTCCLSKLRHCYWEKRWPCWEVEECNPLTIRFMLMHATCSPVAQETRVQSQVESYQRLKKWYLMPPCLTLNIIR